MPHSKKIVQHPQFTPVRFPSVNAIPSRTGRLQNTRVNPAPMPTEITSIANRAQERLRQESLAYHRVNEENDRLKARLAELETRYNKSRDLQIEVLRINETVLRDNRELQGIVDRWERLGTYAEVREAVEIRKWELRNYQLKENR